MKYDEQMHELGNKSIKLNTKYFFPDPSLRELVNYYSVITKEYTHPSDSQWYLLPDNCGYLIFYLFDYGNTLVPEWKIIGPRSRHKIINRKNRHFTFICSFKAGGLSAFVDMPMYELRDQSVEASFMSNYSTNTFGQLTVCALNNNITEFVKTIGGFLMKINTSLSYTHHVLERFTQLYVRNGIRTSLAAVSKELGYSERQLRNLMLSHVGHSPKMVDQIERFTMSLTLSKDNLNWSEIACESGYYDQSHMISDYHKLVGTSPEKLFS